MTFSNIYLCKKEVLKRLQNFMNAAVLYDVLLLLLFSSNLFLSLLLLNRNLLIFHENRVKTKGLFPFVFYLMFEVVCCANVQIVRGICI